jgi:hypothetical protein
MLSDPFAWTLIALIVFSIGLYCDLREQRAQRDLGGEGPVGALRCLLLFASLHSEKVRSQFLSLRHRFSNYDFLRLITASGSSRGKQSTRKYVAY